VSAAVQHLVQPPLRRQHLQLPPPLVRAGIERHQLERDVEAAEAQDLHQGVDRRRDYPLLVPGDYGAILARYLGQLLLAQPGPKSRLLQ
jgi:hypothetical protein